MKHLNLQPASTATPVITEARTMGGQALTGQNKEFNAHSQAELMNVLASVINSNQQFVTQFQAESAEAAVNAVPRTNAEIVTAAQHDAEEFKAMTTAFAEEVQLTRNRDGISRRLMQRMELGQGAEPRIEINPKDVTAQIATGPEQMRTEHVKTQVIRPDEFLLTARPFLSALDIARSDADILQSRYIDALEAIMVQEDRIWKKLADRTINVANQQSIITGTVTTAALATMINQIASWGLDPRFWVIANDITVDLIADSSFRSSFNATAHAEELLQTGSIGMIYGVEVITDQFRHEKHKVFERGEMYVLTGPESHGRYTDRDGLQVKDLDDSHEKVPGMGWSMYSMISQTIVNSRTVAKGLRL